MPNTGKYHMIMHYRQSSRRAIPREDRRRRLRVYGRGRLRQRPDPDPHNERRAFQPMTIRISPSVARFAGVLLYALAAGAARGGQDYEFRHENVLGTSLELCVRADTEHAARSAEAPRSARSTASPLSSADTTRRANSAAGRRLSATDEGLTGAVRAASCQ